MKFISFIICFSLTWASLFGPDASLAQTIRNAAPSGAPANYILPTAPSLAGLRGSISPIAAAASPALFPSSILLKSLHSHALRRRRRTIEAPTTERWDPEAPEGRRAPEARDALPDIQMPGKLAELGKGLTLNPRHKNPEIQHGTPEKVPTASLTKTFLQVKRRSRKAREVIRRQLRNVSPAHPAGLKKAGRRSFLAFWENLGTSPAASEGTGLGVRKRAAARNARQRKSHLSPNPDSKRVPAPKKREPPSKFLMAKWLAGTFFFKVGIVSRALGIPLLALECFGSVTWAAVMFTTWALSLSLSSVLSGGLSDRKPAHEVMAAAMAAQALSIGALVALAFSGIITPWMAIPLYALAGASMGVSEPARKSVPISIVGKKRRALNKLNARTHIVYEISGAVAPLAVGFIIAQFGIVYALAIHPPSYLLAALFIHRLGLKHSRTEFPKRRAGKRKDLSHLLRQSLRDVKEGARTVWSSSPIRWAAIVTALSFGLHGLFESIIAPIFAKVVLLQPGKSGLMLGASNFGELLGALVLLRIVTSGPVKSKNLSRWVRALAVSLLGLWVLVLSRNIALSTLFMFVTGLTWAASDLRVTSFIQKELPDKAEGKALGVMNAAGIGLVMLTYLAVGFFLDHFSPVPVFAGLATIVSALALVLWKAAPKIKKEKE